MIVSEKATLKASDRQKLYQWMFKFTVEISLA
jgi:hypothetical protein